jgi:serine protease inhibitor
MVSPAQPPNPVTADEPAFGLALTRDLERRAEGGNVVDSPLSADLALSMLELGAKGATQSSIARTLVSGQRSAVTQARQWAQWQATGSGAGSLVAIQVANSAWLQAGRTFRPAYLSAVAGAFRGATHVADFSGDNTGATSAINRWVSARTGGRRDVHGRAGAALGGPGHGERSGRE